MLPPPPRLRAARLALHACLLVPLAFASCKKPGRLDIFLRTPNGLALTTVAELDVRLLNETQGFELARATVAGADLDDLPLVFEEANLDPGIEYALEVRGAVDASLCASGRVAGRSLPVTIAGDDEVGSATVYVACADAAAPTASLQVARAAHAAVWAPEQGGAVLVGGASSLGVEGGTFDAAALAAVEVYDPATGLFRTAAPLLEARAVPAAALDTTGRVVVMGGVDDAIFEPLNWKDTVEELDGEARRGKGLLDGRWLGPTVETMSDGTFALGGFGVHVGSGDPPPVTPYQVGFYDAATEQIPHPALSRAVLSPIGVPFPGRGRLLFAGGDSADENPVRPSLLCDAGDCGCSTGPCLVDLGDDDDPAGWGPGPHWGEAAGAWVACPEGGGTAYVIGGRLVDPAEPGREQPLGDVYCYRDDDDLTTDLVHVGTIRPRTGHAVVVLRDGRLLVVGGTETVEVGRAEVQRGVAEAELVSVSACECAPLGPVTEVPVDESLAQMGRSLYARSSTVTLGDGTVLLTGTIAPADLTHLEAGSEAWVFNPALPE